MWQKIASGPDPQSIDILVPIDKLPHNTKFKVVIRTPVPIAPLLDLAGAEWVAEKFHSEAGAILEDVEGVGWNEIVMHFRSNAVWLLLLVGVIAAIFAWGLFTGVDIFAWIANIFKYGAIALAAVAVLYIGSKVIGRKKVVLVR